MEQPIGDEEPRLAMRAGELYTYCFNGITDFAEFIKFDTKEVASVSRE